MLLTFNVRLGRSYGTLWALAAIFILMGGLVGQVVLEDAWAASSDHIVSPTPAAASSSNSDPEMESPTPLPSPIVTVTPSPSPTPTPTPTLTPRPTFTPTPTVIPTPTPILTPTPTDFVNPTTVQVFSSQSTVVVVPTTEPVEGPVTFFKTDDRELASPGQILTYRLVIRNPGDDDITGVKIVDRVPNFLIPLATSPLGTADSARRTITWEDQTISANSEVTFAFQARVAEITPPGFVIHNVADVNGPGIRLSDSDSTVVEGVVLAGVRDVVPSPPSQLAVGVPVPATARTGPGLGLTLGFGSVIGGLGLVRRLWRGCV